MKSHRHKQLVLLSTLFALMTAPITVLAQGHPQNAGDQEHDRRSVPDYSNGNNQPPPQRPEQQQEEQRENQIERQREQSQQSQQHSQPSAHPYVQQPAADRPTSAYGSHATMAQQARQNRTKWRDDRRDMRWNSTEHNGYYRGNTWYYGPPPANLAWQPSFAYGYHPWSTGQRLGYYRTRYHEVNYRDLNRHRPIKGYHWVKDDRGDYLLVAILSGLIVDIIIHR